MKTYPINLVLDNRMVVLIGAGREITRKLAGLLEVGARVKVIAPEATPIILNHAEQGRIEYFARPYQRGDLQGAFLVLACTRNEVVHDEVWAEANENGQLVNVMDVIPQCNYHNTSVIRQGQLTISIGTGGAAPALAATLRKRFEKGFGEEYAEFLDFAENLRPIVAERIVFEKRKDFWYALVESGAIRLLRRGDRATFEAQVESLLNCYAALDE
jgi:siroheme synthase-like protein